MDDQDRYTTFYERIASGLYQPIQAQPSGAIASRVLAGFQFRVKDLYRQSNWQDLVEDPVYQGFVRPEYQAERKRADRAEHRFLLERQQRYQIEKLLTQEQQRTEQADQRADQAEQHLRQESQRADQATATLLTLLRQSLAHRFNLPLDHYDDTLSTLDYSTLTALSEQVFTVADQAAFEALLVC